MPSTNFKVRDKRNKGWFYLDNEYLNGYAKLFGPIGTAIYVSLCRHADNATQTCFPTQAMIAKEHNIARSTVNRYIRLFSECRLLSISNERNESTQQWGNNIYTLLDQSEWRPKDEVLVLCGGRVRLEDTGSRVRLEDTPCPSESKSRVRLEDTKETHLNKTHTNKTQEKTLAPVEVMRTFLSSFQEKSESYMTMLANLEAKGVSRAAAETEIQKFVLYWTERNKSGTKERWELEPTFEVGRRLATWFSRVRSSSGFQREAKGIIIN